MKHEIILEIVCKNMKARKKNLWMTSILLILSVFIFLSGLSLHNALNGIYEDVFLQTNLARMAVFSKGENETKIIDNEIRKLIKSNQIMDGGRFYQTVTGVLTSKDGTYLPMRQYNKGYDKSITVGRGIQNGEVDKIILPKYFSLSNDDYMNQYIHNGVEIKTGSDFLGQKISVNFGDLEDPKKACIKDFEVVGIYDNLKEFSGLNEVIISSGDMKSIRKQIKLDENEKYNYFYITVDAVQNKKKVMDLLEKNTDKSINFENMLVFDSFVTFSTMIKIVTAIVTTMLMIFTFIYISASTLKNLTLRTTEIGLLKTLGYNPSEIKQIIVYENLLIASMGCMIAIILHAFAILGVNYFIASKGIIHLRLIIFKMPVIPMLSIIFLIFIIVYGITLRKISKVYSYESMAILKNA